MGFLDALFGRARPPQPKIEPLFALSTAWVALQSKLGWVPAGRAGLVLKPATGHDFSEAAREVEGLLKLAGEEMGSRLEEKKDEYGYTWLLVQDKDWEDLVSLVHVAGQTLTEKGYGTQLLAAVFRMQREGEESPPLYLIFSYKRGKFYPFIPLGKDRERDNAEEMRLYSLLEKELPWENDLSRWYPLWDCPV
ncbi:MAG: hypothetical protein PWP65_1511 [Clostridia bacterium]|nr:hypothetical protein [Clostridia bacterium]